MLMMTRDVGGEAAGIFVAADTALLPTPLLLGILLVADRTLVGRMLTAAALLKPWLLKDVLDVD